MSQEVKTKFRWNDAEYEFDTRDADCAELLEKAVADMTTAEKERPKDGTASSQIRYQCDMIKAFFDTCLGPGAGIAICTEKSKVDICYEAYQAFINLARDQKRYITDKGNTFRQYSNRNQRRHPQNPGQNKKATSYHDIASKK